MRICVLGSGGFIGGHIARAFPGCVALTHKDLDLTDEHAVNEYFSKNEFDVIFHCAVVGGSRLQKDDWSVLQKNISMFFNVLNASKYSLMYYFSSGAALKKRDEPYGLSKWIIEQYKNPRVQILRVWGCFGPGEPSTRFLSTAKRDGHVTIHSDIEFDFIHIYDVIEFVKKFPVSDHVIDMVYPGPKLRLSQIADMAGVPYTNAGSYTGTCEFEMKMSLKERIQEYLEDESV
jgi:nucleoside-diphosphate-sugar epimerase